MCQFQFCSGPSAGFSVALNPPDLAPGVESPGAASSGDFAGACGGTATQIKPAASQWRILLFRQVEPPGPVENLPSFLISFVL
jgi:hypothetical protein